MKTLLTATLGLIAILFVSEAQATARITKTYAFPIAKYRALEAAIDEAAARPDQKTEFSKVLDANDQSSVTCSEGAPLEFPGNEVERKGWGCSLTFIVDLGGGITAELSQMLALDKTTDQIQQILATENPAQKSQLLLPRIFDGGNGSAYYCDSVRGAWDCKLKMVSHN